MQRAVQGPLSSFGRALSDATGSAQRSLDDFLDRTTAPLGQVTSRVIGLVAAIIMYCCDFNAVIVCNVLLY